MQKILIIEDDKRLADAVSQILIGQDYDVEAITDGLEGYQAALTENYDVMVLDVMLPGKDGISICQDLRSNGISTPILMCTAKSTVTDKVLGLDAGADDYLVKPFHPRELIARIHALTRRMVSYGYDGHVAFGDIEFDADSGLLSCNGESVTLSGKEHEIMKILMSTPGSVFSKDDIITKVWGRGSDIGDNNVEAYISFLRKKLSFLECHVGIRTLRKVGYRLEEIE